jgi:hypothetical protein
MPLSKCDAELESKCFLSDYYANPIVFVGKRVNT